MCLDYGLNSRRDVHDMLVYPTPTSKSLSFGSPHLNTVNLTVLRTSTSPPQVGCPLAAEDAHKAPINESSTTTDGTFRCCGRSMQRWTNKTRSISYCY
jgi:hypothetical protein